MSATELLNLSKEELVGEIESLAQRVATMKQNENALITENEELREEAGGDKELIYKRLLALKADVNAVGKDSKNDFAGWSFRGIDQLLNYFKPLMDKHKIGLIMNGTFDKPTFVENQKTGKSTKHCNLIMQYTFFTDDGSKVQCSVPTEAVATDDKGVAKSLSQALKYLFIQTFVTPTEDVADPDRGIVNVNGDEVVKKPAAVKSAPRKAPAAAKTPAKKSSSFRKKAVAATVEVQDEL